MPTATCFSRQLSACDFVKGRKFSNRQKNNWKLLFPLILVRMPFIYLFNFFSDHICKNMPAVDLKTVSVARSDLTTLLIERKVPRMHVTWTFPAKCHVNTQHTKFKQASRTEQQRLITKLIGT